MSDSHELNFTHEEEAELLMYEDHTASARDGMEMVDSDPTQVSGIDIMSARTRVIDIPPTPQEAQDVDVTSIAPMAISDAQPFPVVVAAPAPSHNPAHDYFATRRATFPTIHTGETFVAKEVEIGLRVPLYLFGICANGVTTIASEVKRDQPVTKATSVTKARANASMRHLTQNIYTLGSTK